LIVTPWAATITAAERDENLKFSLRDEELQGFLAWVIEGARLYLSGGLQIPQSLTDATDSLRESCDELGLWLDARCEQVPGVLTQSSTLYKDFRRWNEEHEGNKRSISQQTFTQRLCTKGFALPKKRGRDGLMHWSGLRLRDQARFLDEADLVDAPPAEVTSLLDLIVPAYMIPSDVPVPQLERMPGGSWVV
jgi:phage/plasmid-associated DNA primase